ncbi:putative 3-demethylubiquinone-9 3-methyltransferase (glyoxalase superfamily) [Natronospira proteinivora]|uniref:3-demethylubiquinone-9 3-methyltransferase (Glyoxalase superfamily) n=1 Tax=Natronospira proteinivora TaxID=1807133 RepID=A0ABT1G8J6_9GAMM|nr:VOC family protein [Natronospira proteinivora]MCP1727646.1 putative 3-demethylubiquinone-9 3-methyltransferase (glyoxalase superfamily) [Natronospira proteinivora]
MPDTITLNSLMPCLWFDDQAEEAAAFYTRVFPNSQVGKIVRKLDGSGEALTVTFTLDGRDFVALNGGPHFQFNEAVSFQVLCDNQEQLDYYWQRLGEGGDEAARQCGWLKDRYGLSWQIVPVVLPELVSDADPARAERAMNAMMQMKKLDIAALQAAAEGA